MDWWTWLARKNPGFSQVTAWPAPPEGLRLLPEAGKPTLLPLKEINRDPDSIPEGHLELFLVDRTFGTEELSSYSPSIHRAEAAPRLLLSAQDAAKLGLAPGERVTLRLPGGPLTIEIEVAASMAAGVMFLPRHRQLSWRRLPAAPLLVLYAAIEKV